MVSGNDWYQKMINSENIKFISPDFHVLSMKLVGCVPVHPDIFCAIAFKDHDISTMTLLESCLYIYPKDITTTSPLKSKCAWNLRPPLLFDLRVLHLHNTYYTLDRIDHKHHDIVKRKPEDAVIVHELDGRGMPLDQYVGKNMYVRFDLKHDVVIDDNDGRAVRIPPSAAFITRWIFARLINAVRDTSIVSKNGGAVHKMMFYSFAHMRFVEISDEHVRNAYICLEDNTHTYTSIKTKMGTSATATAPSTCITPAPSKLASSNLSEFPEYENIILFQESIVNRLRHDEVNYGSKPPCGPNAHAHGPLTSSSSLIVFDGSNECKRSTVRVDELMRIVESFHAAEDSDSSILNTILLHVQGSIYLFDDKLLDVREVSDIIIDRWDNERCTLGMRFALRNETIVTVDELIVKDADARVPHEVEKLYSERKYDVLDEGVNLLLRDIETCREAIRPRTLRAWINKFETLEGDKLCNVRRRSRAPEHMTPRLAHMLSRYCCRNAS